jgi:hypothetical protein
MLGDIPAGQYIKHSSIYDSNNRCITVHGTNNTVVQSNTCFNCIGHQYFLENGVEVGNTFDGNLGILAVRPLATQAILPSDILQGPFAYGPATFWISNANNTFTNNVAAGSVGTGFWYELEDDADGPYAGTGYSPNTRPFATFQNNVAHSMTEALTTCSSLGSIYGPATFDNVWPLTDFVSYGTYIGLWPCGSPQLYENIIVAEAIIGLQDPTKQYLKNVAFVNYLDGAVTKPTLTTGVYLYDSGWAADHVLFQNYDETPQYSVFRIVAGTDYDTGTRVSNVTLVNSPVLFTDATDITYNGVQGEWGVLVNDLDGTLTGSVGTLTTGHPMASDSLCSPLGSATVCPYHYGEPRIMYNGTGLPTGQLGRYNYKTGGGIASSIYSPPSFWPLYRFSAIANEDYVFTFFLPTTTIQLTTITLQPYSEEGDTIAVELHNVAELTNISGASEGTSCYDVYDNKGVQSYYMDTADSILCVRLVATIPDDTNSPFGFQTSIGLSVTPGTFQGTTSGLKSTGITTDEPTNPYALSYQCTCIAARDQYWKINTDVAAANFDPVFHYQNSGGLEGREWYCSECSVNPYYADASYCNCSAAIKLYLSDYAVNSMDAFTHYLQHYLISGNAWHCTELCGPAPTGPPGPPGEVSDDTSNSNQVTFIVWTTLVALLFTLCTNRLG